MTNATEFRNILIDLPDFPAGVIGFYLLTELAANSTEGFPRKDYQLMLNASGQGTQPLPVPSSGAWLWRVTLPNGRVPSPNPTLAAGSDLQLTTWLASAQSTVTAASLADQFAGLANFDAHVADETAVHGITDTALLETVSGAQAKADAVAADLTTHESDTSNPHAVTAVQAGADPAGSAAAAEAASLPRDGVINAQSATYELVAGDAGKIIECSGTFTVTLPNGLDTGFQCTIINVGAGVITLAAATTLQSADAAVTLATQYKAAVVYHRGSNVWLAAGGLE